MAKVDELTRRVEDLRDENAGLGRDKIAAHLAGWQEARAAVGGAVLGLLVVPPTVVGVSMAEDELLIMAQCAEDSVIPKNTLLLLVQDPTGQQLGVLRVKEIDTASSIASLSVAVDLNSKYWAALRELAIVDTSAPTNLRFERMKIPETPTDWSPVEQPSSATDTETRE